MKALSRYAALAVALAAAHMLSACASVQDQPGMPAPGAASTAATDPLVEITGSRIPVRRSDKMVAQIGAQDYKENKSTLTSPLEAH
jgi:hypothetical protein